MEAVGATRRPVDGVMTHSSAVIRVITRLRLDMETQGVEPRFVVVSRPVYEEIILACAEINQAFSGALVESIYGLRIVMIDGPAEFLQVVAAPMDQVRLPAKEYNKP